MDTAEVAIGETRSKGQEPQELTVTNDGYTVFEGDCGDAPTVDYVIGTSYFGTL